MRSGYRFADAELGLVFVGGADFGVVSFGDYGHCVVRQKGLGADDVGGVDLLVQVDSGIGAAVDKVADRVGFEGGLGELPVWPNRQFRHFAADLRARCRDPGRSRCLRKSC
jgi:hypothetical protein